MAFYRGARMLAAPSLWREAFGIVAAEAMSHGVPVIASRIGGLSDVVRDGETGLLFEPNDVDGLATQMRPALGQPGALPAPRRSRPLRAQQEFSGEAHMRRLTEAYGRALSAGSQEGGPKRRTPAVL